MGDLEDKDMERTFYQFITLISLFERNPLFAQNERHLNIPQVYDGGGQWRNFEPFVQDFRGMEHDPPRRFSRS